MITRAQAKDVVKKLQQWMIDYDSLFKYYDEKRMEELTSPLQKVMEILEPRLMDEVGYRIYEAPDIIEKYGSTSIEYSSPKKEYILKTTEEFLDYLVTE
jgi:hypothetical protein